MNRIRTIGLLLVSLVLALCACSAPRSVSPTETPAPAASASFSPSPAPVTAHVIAVFGAEEFPSFREGVLDAAEGGAYPVVFVSGDVSTMGRAMPEDASAAIVFLTDSADTIPHTGIPLYVFAARGQGMPVDLPFLTYAYAGAAQTALDCAVAYPPHLTPVRLIGLFENRDSLAYAAWEQAAKRGDVFSKLEFFADESEEPLSDWMTDAFARYFPGMLDGIYAETGTLAVEAAQKLASLGRGDVEVFSAGTDADAERRLSPILICAVGANHKMAGALCYEAAAKLAAGESVQSGVLMPEALWYQPE